MHGRAFDGRKSSLKCGRPSSLQIAILERQNLIVSRHQKLDTIFDGSGCGTAAYLQILGGGEGKGRCSLEMASLRPPPYQI